MTAGVVHKRVPSMTRVWKALKNAADSLASVSLVMRRPDGDPKLRNLVEVQSEAVSSGVN